MSRYLVIRYGAYGDSIIISPVIRWLKEQGHEVFLHTSERGLEIFNLCPHVDEFVPYVSESIPLDKLGAYWAELYKQLKCDRVINFTETIENSLCATVEKKELWNLCQECRKMLCNINYYEHTLAYAGVPVTPENLKAEIYLSKEVEDEAKKYLDWNKFNIVVGLIGSGMQKMYPWMPLILNEVVERYGDIVNIIIVGDPRCHDIESIVTDKGVRKLSGKIPMLVSCALAKYANLVISPDTGLLHASGCYSTPKIGILCHTTKENITKTFENDYSIEADPEKAPCAPCYKIVKNIREHCDIDPQTHAAGCMGVGIDPRDVLDRIDMVINKHWRKKGRK